jgi:hypothetical protein
MSTLHPDQSGSGSGMILGLPVLYSSFLFFTNAIVAYWYKHFFYSSMFALLGITSIMVHGNFYKEIFLIIDKIVILLIIFTGGYMFYKKAFCSGSGGEGRNKHVQSCFIIFSFLFVLFINYYGYFNNTFNFGNDITEATFYHVLIHVFSSLGHHAIILL